MDVGVGASHLPDRRLASRVQLCGPVLDLVLCFLVVSRRRVAPAEHLRRHVRLRLRLQLCHYRRGVHPVGLEELPQPFRLALLLPEAHEQVLHLLVAIGRRGGVALAVPVRVPRAVTRGARGLRGVAGGVAPVAAGHAVVTAGVVGGYDLLLSSFPRRRSLRSCLLDRRPRALELEPERLQLRTSRGSVLASPRRGSLRLRLDNFQLAPESLVLRLGGRQRRLGVL